MQLLFRNIKWSSGIYRVIRNSSTDSIKTSRLRNIGIIAHVDAGKTTVTERLLFLSGATRYVGNVDSGNTVTDFLEMERERGITIQSAVVTFSWQNHDISLIDTPGHVDFTMEVERSVRVLDGAVTVIDSSAGVQAQTFTVWKQAKHFGVPAIFFLNKMDKAGSNLERNIDSIEHKLGVKGKAFLMEIFKQ
ncbi:hypothetical protein WR25_18448 [Diploscapter pachys]|uniref:Tr-type G domain-containing protein n=1 Tax=Diploscapter pachys TaxID=2018661 RepID=A0A2A2L7Z3_9BILA|nr:hypothetical protein WR25_18448 [Diploscapter pachys]